MAIENKIENNITTDAEVEVPVKKVEHSVEESIEKSGNQAESIKKRDLKKDPTLRPNAVPATTIASVSSNYSKQIEMIENIMSDGLDQEFLKMSPAEQKHFKEEGEKTATKIKQLLDSAKISLEKIITLIRRWLILIPHVNKFFSEQESKIKADKIIKIKNSL